MSARSAAYLAELALRTDHSHEPRREECPWCGSKRLLTSDRFPLDQCRDCAHAFQNPGLTPPPESEVSERRLLATARALLPFGEPESWLDIGTGEGAFPAAARKLFPYTSFDGVDPTARIEKARAVGHVEEAYVGDLTNPHLTAHLRGRYDVVSLLRHLTHTPNPRAQLRAALTALRPGAHLLLELPDPHSAFAKLLGRWWYARTRPRHLIPLENIRTELEFQGCGIIKASRMPFSNGYRIIARREPA
ncbi:class I SAM-dependent methyltransferase [Streptomyces sp. P17]|uniref:class I SAM-dependent methyltransferase n=1 Tax=Streptomyces sp. P17 TaxID=3074716 RepID=UPI0028F407D7|nr:class I SAM-dependent methyltransferase [Streptomyces sp. P17]MDT9701015.1 class I SAM-dependent methyltransferase [Streptomyces sp. P17]